MAEKINTTQPKSYQWMAKPENRGDVPAGLEYIDSLTSIHLKQKIDTLEVLTGWQVRNKFRLTDPVTGQVIGLFKEESDCFQRQCCKNQRAFKANIIDSQGQTIFSLDRPLHCNCFCCPTACDGGCGQEITANDSSGNFLGKVTMQQQCAICVCCLDWMLNIADANGQVKWKLGNGICAATCVCCDDRYLYVYDSDGNKVSTVTKQWRGMATECCTPADSILIEFPNGMTVQEKATLIGAVLLSDYNLWEQQNNN